MTDYPLRLRDSFLGSEIVPAFLRTKLMRLLGYDLSPDTCVWGGGCFRSSKVATGARVFINVGFFHDGYADLKIGNNVRIGQFVRVITASHPMGPSSERGLKDVAGGPVRIEDGCWIGSAVTILPNITIACGCVIAAGSIVSDDTLPNGLYAGNPARRVRDLEE